MHKKFGMTKIKKKYTQMVLWQNDFLLGAHHGITTIEDVDYVCKKIKV
jgi:hypothetical protein